MLDFHEDLLNNLPLNRLKPSGESHFVALCPFHQDSSPSLSIHRHTGYYSCFACGASGPFEYLYKHLTGKSLNISRPRHVSAAPVLDILDKLNGKQVTTEKVEETELHNYEHKIHLEIADRIDHRIDIIKYFELGYDSAELQSVFPVRNEDGHLVGIVRRNLNGVQPKYRNAFKKTNYLYNLYRAKQYKTAIVVEGPMDVIKSYMNGYPNCVALLGKSMSPRQQQLLLRHFTELILALDADEAGRKGVDTLIRKLKGKIKLFILKYPSGYKDIGDLDADRMKILVENAQEVR